MGKLIAGMASSHAATLVDPSSWSDHRTRNRQRYASRYGSIPPEHPRVALETMEDLQSRYTRIRDGLESLRHKLEQVRPDALIILGDDQNENFTEANLPQIALYAGEGFLANSSHAGAEPLRYPSNPALAEAILSHCVDAGIDMALVRSLPNNLLKAHAFGPILRTVDPEARIPVVPTEAPHLTACTTWPLNSGRCQHCPSCPLEL